MKASSLYAAGLLGLSALLASCSAPMDSPDTSGPPSPGQVQPGSPDPGNLGSVGLELSLPAGESIEVVSWSITGPSGASTVVQSGSANTKSLGLSVLISRIPPGSGYRMTLSGSATNGSVTCTGSAVFNVGPRTTTQVPIALACSVATSGAHVALVNGSSFDCAAWGNVSASPAETNVGTGVTLSATATGPSPGALSFAWSAPSGSFSNASAATTTFTCASPGPVAVTLRVADGPVPVGDSCDPALTTRTVPVICDAVLPDGGTTPAPALPPWAIAGLAALFAAVGATALRSRRSPLESFRT